MQGALAKRNADSMGAMKYAIKAGQLETVGSLLREGFDINTIDYDGRTLLHAAAAMGETKLVEILVKEFDASVTITDRRGNRWTPG